MLKRLFILAVMLGSVLMISTTKLATAETFCSCARVCIAGENACQFTCDGGTLAEHWTAAQACCAAAKENTPIECGAR